MRKLDVGAHLLVQVCSILNCGLAIAWMLKGNLLWGAFVFLCNVITFTIMGRIWRR